MHNRDHMPSLSIVSPLDVLRDKMMQDIIERSIKNKIQANDKILKDLGKRSAASAPPPDDVAASLLRRDDDRSSFSPQVRGSGLAEEASRPPRQLPLDEAVRRVHEGCCPEVAAAIGTNNTAKRTLLWLRRNSDSPVRLNVFLCGKPQSSTG
ncbi:hypothetical protein HPB48_008433 [Haemaphysalis longicornis]|uniref:Corticotropin-releasing factor domain-containing protein n=1 Tax=Haemaphysalis longicornis TaxID=44386 RepID=A0A9J6GZP2_HAELO|nr:hypothetical protein HPB48_008433 [Haemaphysalis longicornis]